MGLKNSIATSSTSAAHLSLVYLCLRQRLLEYRFAALAVTLPSITKKHFASNFEGVREATFLLLEEFERFTYEVPFLPLLPCCRHAECCRLPSRQVSLLLSYSSQRIPQRTLSEKPLQRNSFLPLPTRRI